MCLLSVPLHGLQAQKVAAKVQRLQSKKGVEKVASKTRAAQKAVVDVKQLMREETAAGSKVSKTALKKDEVEMVCVPGPPFAR